MIVRHAGIVTFVLLLAVAEACAQSPLAAEVETLAYRYHENPARLDQVRAGLEEALKTDTHVKNLVALARVSFFGGDGGASREEENPAANARGREAAQRARELEP